MRRARRTQRGRTVRFRVHVLDGERLNAGALHARGMVAPAAARGSRCRVSNETYFLRAMAQILRGWKARFQNVEPLLCLQDWGLVESSRERSRQGHSIQVETAGEFRCRPRGELACRFTSGDLERYFAAVDDYLARFLEVHPADQDAAPACPVPAAHLVLPSSPPGGKGRCHPLFEINSPKLRGPNSPDAGDGQKPAGARSRTVAVSTPLRESIAPPICAIKSSVPKSGDIAPGLRQSDLSDMGDDFCGSGSPHP